MRVWMLLLWMACDGDKDGSEDADGDGLIGNQDCDDENPLVLGAPLWYRDADADNYGDPETPQASCTQPTGYVAVADDCDDGDVSSNPGATERCDSYNRDEDCDGLSDDADDTVDASGYVTGAADADADGHGDPDATVTACDPPGITAEDDCDDGDPTIYPGAVEQLDRADDDCDGSIDNTVAASVANGAVYGALTHQGLGNAGDLALAGDLDGDGGLDLVITSDELGAGTLWAISGADLLSQEGGPDDLAFLTITGPSADTPIARANHTAGDVSGDGVADLLVHGVDGALGDDDSQGVAWLFSGVARGSLLVNSAMTSFVPHHDAAWIRAGDLADIDGDGLSEMMLGSPEDTLVYNDWGGTFEVPLSGSVAFFSGASLPTGETSIEEADERIFGDHDNDNLGYIVGAVGDLDEDGYQDVMLGAPGYDGSLGGGAVYVVPGVGDLSWTGQYAANAAMVRIDGTSTQAIGATAWAPADADPDGDGREDLLLSASASGESWLWWFPTWVPASTLSTEDADLRVLPSGGVSAWGTTIAADLDGDGEDSLIAGTPYTDTRYYGEVRLYHGLTSAVRTLQSADSDGIIAGTNRGDYVGTTVTAGDLDGDGDDELLVGAIGADVKATDGGAIYAVDGG